jgi:hypothetical protein
MNLGPLMSILALHSTDQLLAVATIAAATAMIEYFDISLPRGDGIGVSGTLNSAALVMLGPRAALATSLTGALVALGLKSRRERTVSSSIELPALLVALATAAAVDALILAELGGYTELRALVVSSTYLLVELAVVQALTSARSGRSYAQPLASARQQLPLLLAQVSACMLAVIIYPTMQEWSLLLVVVLLLLIRQSYALLLSTRDTYRMTVEVLVEAAEGTDVRRIGHSERTAAIAREIGASYGVSGRQIERLNYAALLHDIDALGSETRTANIRPSEVLEGQETFADIIPVLRVLEGGWTSSLTADDVLAAFIVGLSSDIDANQNPSLCSIHEADESVRLATLLPTETRVGIVSTALRLGYGVPAIS